MNRITVSVSSLPEVGQLRPAIEAALSARAWPSGPEQEIGRAVAEYVARQRDTQVLPSGQPSVGGNRP